MVAESDSCAVQVDSTIPAVEGTIVVSVIIFALILGYLYLCWLLLFVTRMGD